MEMEMEIEGRMEGIKIFPVAVEKMTLVRTSGYRIGLCFFEGTVVSFFVINPMASVVLFL